MLTWPDPPETLKWRLRWENLMDAIECGIVKLPRVPVAQNLPGAKNDELPMFRELWKHIGKKMPKKGRGKGAEDPLNLIVEIKGYRGEDAKEKKSAMDTYWVPGVNNLKQYGRWAFAEFTDVFQMQDDFARKVEAEFNKMIEAITSNTDGGAAT